MPLRVSDYEAGDKTPLFASYLDLDLDLIEIPDEFADAVEEEGSR